MTIFLICVTDTHVHFYSLMSMFSLWSENNTKYWYITEKTCGWLFYSSGELERKEKGAKTVVKNHIPSYPTCCTIHDTWSCMQLYPHRLSTSPHVCILNSVSNLMLCDVGDVMRWDGTVCMSSYVVYRRGTSDMCSCKRARITSPSSNTCESKALWVELQTCRAPSWVILS